MNEEWCIVKDYNKYEISSLGRLRRNNKIIQPSICNGNYLMVHLFRNGEPQKVKKIHRLVCEAFHENLENKEDVDHINRIRTDNRRENLRWVTRRENLLNKIDSLNEMRGIYWLKKYNKFRIQLKVNKKTRWFGYAFNVEDAKIIRDNAILKLKEEGISGY